MLTVVLLSQCGDDEPSPKTVVLLSQCEKDELNPIVTIPDNNFLSALINLGVDTNGDGIICSQEAEAITFLDVKHKSIADMTGIEAFVNLERLECGGNQLSKLDVSNNTALTELYCWRNQLTALDVSNNTALTVLDCWRNQLTWKSEENSLCNESTGRLWPIAAVDKRPFSTQRAH